MHFVCVVCSYKYSTMDTFHRKCLYKNSHINWTNNKSLQHFGNKIQKKSNQKNNCRDVAILKSYDNVMRQNRQRRQCTLFKETWILNRISLLWNCFVSNEDIFSLRVYWLNFDKVSFRISPIYLYSEQKIKYINRKSQNIWVIWFIENWK